MKTVFMFPGQGSQYIGMAKDFYDCYPCARTCFEEAGRAAGLDMEALIFEENDRLNITEYTQIAMLTAEAAMLRVVEEMGIRPDMNIGLSLGEYAALVSSGVLSYEDACSVVRQRGIYMEKEVPAGVGAMSAVLGMDSAAIENVLADTVAELEKEGVADAGGQIGIANYNCPGQIVISGEAGAVARAGANLCKAGAKRVVPLKVSGPFHSAMLKGAGDKLAKVLCNVTIHPAKVPYVANYSAKIVSDTRTADVRELLEKQVYSPVRFEQSVRLLCEQGYDTFLEIGPGRTLSGFVKKISRDVRIINIEKVEELEKLKDLV